MQLIQKQIKKEGLGSGGSLAEWGGERRGGGKGDRGHL